MRALWSHRCGRAHLLATCHFILVCIMSLQAPIRRIGRCDLGTKLDPPWPCTVKDAQDVFSFDASDPACMDIYTNSATLYNGVYLFFPSVFMHMAFAESEDKGNDGILEGRLAVSRDGVSAAYVDAPNGRAAFLPLGVNRCAPMLPSTYPAGVEWCPGNNPASDGQSDFDAAEIYTAAGETASIPPAAAAHFAPAPAAPPPSFPSSCSSYSCSLLLSLPQLLLLLLLLLFRRRRRRCRLLTAGDVCFAVTQATQSRWTRRV